MCWSPLLLLKKEYLQKDAPLKCWRFRWIKAKLAYYFDGGGIYFPYRRCLYKVRDLTAPPSMALLSPLHLVWLFSQPILQHSTLVGKSVAAVNIF